MNLSAVKFSGNTVYTEAELLAVLGDIKGKAYDLAGLQDLARKITAHYRQSGYPYARAIVPAQRLTVDWALRGAASWARDKGRYRLPKLPPTLSNKCPSSVTMDSALGVTTP